MMKYFEGGRFKLNIETWFKSDKSLERHNCIKMTANEYSGSTVTRTSIVIEVGISRELQSEFDTHHGLRLTSKPEAPTEDEQIADEITSTTGRIWLGMESPPSITTAFL
eukprot:scaffold85834_cov44-Cyclotella_meneghiniana.AAC.11